MFIVKTTPLPLSFVSQLHEECGSAVASGSAARILHEGSSDPRETLQRAVLKPKEKQKHFDVT